MIEYIKKAYTSPIDGVTNTETAWKVTTDTAGLNIVDSKPSSAEWIDVFYSNVMIPINTEVYVWYKMKLSNNEIKDWAGPYAYQSRDSNISNDLKPLTRVETPRIIPTESLLNGSNVITFNSSLFRGDKLDGILAATWIAKNPAGKIIKDAIFSLTDIESFSLSRSINQLDTYEYIDIYLKHHSANGSVSDFAKERFSLAVYPFKFVGSTDIDANKDYKFNVVPYDPTKPNIKNIKVIDVSDRSTVYTFTNMSTLEFTIPANVLKPNRTYRIELYVENLTLDGKKYPVKMDVAVYTIVAVDRMSYDTSVNYDLNSLVSRALISPSAKGEHLLIDGKAYVLSTDGMSIHKYILTKATDTISITPCTIHANLLPYLGNDAKLFNTKDNTAVLVSRLGTLINIVRCLEVNGIFYIDSRYNVISIPCANSRQYITNTSTISMDDNIVYVHSRDSVSVNFDKIDLARNTITRLLNRDDLTLANYTPNNMLIITSNTDSVLSLGGTIEPDLYYEYMVKTDQWVPRGSLPVGSMTTASFIPDSILLQNKSVLFLNDDTVGFSINLIDYLARIESIPSTIPITNYTVSLLSDVGDLYMINSSNSTYIKVDSVK